MADLTLIRQTRYDLVFNCTVTSTGDPFDFTGYDLFVCSFKNQISEQIELSYRSDSVVRNAFTVATPKVTVSILTADTADITSTTYDVELVAVKNGEIIRFRNADSPLQIEFTDPDTVV